MRKQLTILLSLLTIHFSSAQSFNLINFDIETGFNTVGADNMSLSRMRNSSVADDDWCRFDIYDYDSRINNFYIGVKPEFAIFNKLSVDAGLRFTYTQSDYDNDDRRFSYWLVEQNEDKTSLIRVRDIEQKSYWIGIPIDIRFVPCDLDQTSVYIKAGCAMNMRVATHNNVKTYSRDMKHYEKTIEKQIENPNNFALPIWMGVGIQFGRDGAFCIEMTFPYIVEFAKMSSLCEADHTAFGMQFTYRLPYRNSKYNFQ